MESLGKKLRALREAHGKTQDAVGDDLGMSQGMISALEKDKGDPVLSTLKRLAGYYKVELSELLGATDAISSDNLDAIRLTCITAIVAADKAELQTILDALKPVFDRTLKKDKRRSTSA